MGLAVEADLGVPALVLKVGQYPVHSGGVGVIRSLGRMGVRVFATTEPGLTPAAWSRYCAGHFTWRVTGAEEPAEIAAQLAVIGGKIARQAGRRAVAIPVDDESAVLLAERAAELAECLAFPAVPSGLPRRLASKSGLRELCAEHKIPTPASVVPASAAEAERFAATATFPVVVKNAGIWERRRRNPAGASLGASASGARVLRTGAELQGLIRPDGMAPGLLIQEHIPADRAENWFVHLYCDASSNCQVLFTGLKVRSWPVDAGVTACGVSVSRPDLAELASRFCKEVGYQGIADLDWVRDLRDGEFKLVDFNPRVGNQFRLFQTGDGVDVVRALHLDLTGRKVPAGRQIDGRRMVVEHIDLAARVAYRRLGGVAGSGAGRTRVPDPEATEFAWLAADDPMPGLVVLTRVLSLARIIKRGLRPRRGRAGDRGAP